MSRIMSNGIPHDPGRTNKNIKKYCTLQAMQLDPKQKGNDQGDSGEPKNPSFLQNSAFPIHEWKRYWGPSRIASAASLMIGLEVLRQLQLLDVFVDSAEIGDLFLMGY